ncbi:MAG: hypothetical protein ACTS10_10920 [Kiloniellales bacterium]
MRFASPLTWITVVFRRPAARETQTVFDQQRALIAALKGENYRLRRHLERAECENARLREAFAPLTSTESATRDGKPFNNFDLISIRVTKGQFSKAHHALRDRGDV